MSQSHPIGSVPGLPEAIEKHNEAQKPAAPAPIDWGVTLKRILAGVVVAAGAGAAIFPPHTVAHQVCVAILGLGGLGITSQGVRK
jgi:hypothetical protein